MIAHATKDITYHDEIAAEYNRTVVAPRVVTNDVVYSRLGRYIPPGREMLDLGCGTGHLTGRFGPRFDKVTAVDHSAGMLLEAERQVAAWKYSNVSLIREDAQTFLTASQADQFDFVGSVGFLHHLQPAEIVETLSQIVRILKFRGRAVFQEPICIPAGSLPERIAKWNARSVVTRMQYCHTAPHPDEAPLDLEVFRSALVNAGFRIQYQMRSWEIFPHSLPPTASDRLRIRLLNTIYGRTGNVYSVVAERIAPVR